MKQEKRAGKSKALLTGALMAVMAVFASSGAHAQTNQGSSESLAPALGASQDYQSSEITAPKRMPYPHPGHGSMPWGYAVAGSRGVMEIQVLDRSTGRPLQVYFAQGKYWVAGEMGREFEVRLWNKSAKDVLAVLALDGKNAVSGEAAAWNQTGYVLGSYGSMNVKGWRKNLNEVAAFYFTSKTDSYANRMGAGENAGVIGVAVFLRKEEPRILLAPRRAEERSAKGSRGGAGSAPSGSAESSAAAPGAPAPMMDQMRKAEKLGTGHGQREHSSAVETAFERASLRPFELIEIRYDSAENLMRQGVIPRPVPVPLEPTPRSFPGQRFAPDPR